MSDSEKEIGFAESYRSQILHPKEDEEENSSKNLIIISLLTIIVVALGLFGYNYLSQTDNAEIKTDKVEESIEEESVAPPESMMLNNINELMDEEEQSTPPQSDTLDTIKLEVEKEEVKKVEEKKTSKQKAEDTYLEQLAELSKEIDGDK